MRLTITKTTTSAEVEGAASEIAEALPAVLAADHVPASTSVLAPVESDRLLAAPETAAIVVPVEETLPYERIRDMELDWDASAPTGPESAAPSGPFTEWQDVPADRRVWNAIGSLCHVARTPNDRHDLFCGFEVGQARRQPAPGHAHSVCGNCNRRIAEAVRP